MITRRLIHALVCAAALAANPALALARAVDFDKLLPADTEVVITINVKHFLDSPLGKKHALGRVQGLLASSPDAVAMLKALGFDPFQDLTSLCASSAGLGDNDRTLLIARGKFDTAKFQAKAQELAKSMGDVVKIGKSDEFVIYELRLPTQDQTIFVGMPGDSALVASTRKESVADAMARAVGKSPGETKKELRGILDKVNGSQAAWFAMPGSTLAKGAAQGNEEKSRKNLEKIDSIHGGVAVTGGLRVELTVATLNAESAQALLIDIREGFAQAKGLVAVVAANDKSLQPALEFLNGLQIKADGAVIRIEGSLTEEAVDKALKSK